MCKVTNMTLMDPLEEDVDPHVIRMGPLKMHVL